MTAPFAVFDIDGTLIRWQLFHAIVHGLGKHGHLSSGAHERIHQARMEWKRRTTDDEFAKYELVLVKEYRAALTRIDPVEYAAVVQTVFDEYKDQTYVYTRRLVRALRTKGYMLLAISGSQQEVVEKLAAHHGFDIALGATLEQIDGKFSGNIDTPVFDKGAALKHLVARHGLDLAGSIAVGDSHSDVSMLQLVEHPIAFNPDKRLYAAATKQGWTIVVERKNMTYELVHQNGQYVLQSV